MRGDSLRDLYAKTLAVVGLGLLAGAGAIVDYWPVGGELPKVLSLASLRPALPVAAQLQPDVPVSTPIRITRAAVATPHRAFADSLATVTFADVEPTVAEAKPDAALVNEAEGIRIEDCSALLFAATSELELLRATPTDSIAADSQPEPHWSFTGAMKRTRETIKEARTFLGGKLGGVVGAFRKVSPFWDTTSVTQLR